MTHSFFLAKRRGYCIDPLEISDIHFCPKKEILHIDFLRKGMLKSKDDAYLKSSSFKSNSCIFGKGNGFLFILFLSSLKSETKQKFK